MRLDKDQFEININDHECITWFYNRNGIKVAIRFMVNYAWKERRKDLSYFSVDRGFNNGRISINHDNYFFRI